MGTGVRVYKKGDLVECLLEVVDDHDRGHPVVSFGGKLDMPIPLAALDAADQNPERPETQEDIDRAAIADEEGRAAQAAAPPRRQRHPPEPPSA